MTLTRRGARPCPRRLRRAVTRVHRRLFSCWEAIRHSVGDADFRAAGLARNRHGRRAIAACMGRAG